MGSTDNQMNFIVPPIPRKWPWVKTERISDATRSFGYEQIEDGQEVFDFIDFIALSAT
jgi:hypothetical protein